MARLCTFFSLQQPHHTQLSSNPVPICVLPILPHFTKTHTLHCAHSCTGLHNACCWMLRTTKHPRGKLSIPTQTQALRLRQPVLGSASFNCSIALFAMCPLAISSLPTVLALRTLSSCRRLHLCPVSEGRRPHPLARRRSLRAPWQWASTSSGWLALSPSAGSMRRAEPT